MAYGSRVISTNILENNNFYFFARHGTLKIPNVLKNNDDFS